MSRKIALVTGATGAIGPSLVSHLLGNGYDVRVYSRRPPVGQFFSNGATFIAGDITNSAALRRALLGVDVVFHLAALLHIENPPPSIVANYRRVNVEGTRMVAEQAAQAGVQRFIYFSTVKVYGIHTRRPVDESCLPRPRTIYAQTKLAGEQAALAVHGLETTVLRLSAVFGPRLKGSWQRLLQAVVKGTFLPIGRLSNMHSLTYVDDVAQAALRIAESPHAPGKVYNIVGYERPTLKEILEAIYAGLGKSAPRISIPTPLALIGAFALEKFLPCFGKTTPITVSAMQQLVMDEVYSGETLRGLGFAPQLSLDEGWQRTIQEQGLA